MVIKKLYKALSLKNILLPAVLLSLAACNNPVFDEEGECVVNYNLRFVYNMNLKWADAFPSEVHSVHLYAYDSAGKFVKEFIANGDAVDQEDYRMQLDLAPGKYKLVAWCGMDNEGATKQHFTVLQPTAQQSKLEDLTCALKLKTDEKATNYSNDRLDFLYHGILEVELPDVYNGTYEYTMPLTKNTNHIRIVLQQLTTEDMDPEEFSFRMEDTNGLMAHDNRLLPHHMVTYHPFNVGTGSAGMVPQGKGDDDIVYADALVADMSTSRLMANHSEDFMFTIESEDKVIARLPLLQYALMSKEYYEVAYGHTMTDQEFLDRQDEYLFTFFLDDSKRWVEMHINILDWRIVIKNYEIGG